MLPEDATYIMGTLITAKRNCRLLICCDLAGVAVFVKESAWDKVKIDLVFPTSWNLGVSIDKDDYKMFPYSPNKTEHLHIGTVSNLDKSL